ncbi:tetratricopeptide repeat protein [Synechococcales cyanobacterium C]|uniref:Tetratricopeptide repeat protein n=1 Tax=Petrachloros mirabilis ULC683 TaxID=2781853 RepID=A0A8K1ZXW8_9CYAN|nr:tetratricopeptide repeat protein [Petrachloros mirabilis]NCJ06121.1 tetratricopeptide repeat protein [Petrachloros mirabilis ULC683]
MSLETEQLDPQQQVLTAFAQAQNWFERGQYQDAIAALTQARSSANPNSRLGGDIQMWLVTAYEAAGQRQEALALCRTLGAHPDWQTRKQSKRLLYILEAPKLELRPEWLTEIPDLSQVQDPGWGKGSGAASAAPPRWRAPEPEGSPLVTDSLDNGFVWLGLAMTGLILVGLLCLA